MLVKTSQLKQLAIDIVVLFRLSAGEKLLKELTMIDYHGFAKSRLPEEFQKKVLWSYKLTPSEVQIEVIKVTTDLRHEIHYHAEAFAYVVGLGSREHLPEPRGASVYLGHSWKSFAAGEKLEIPAGTNHGFTVEEGGELWFLSIQTPPIVDGQGRDDYYRPAP
jgi:quercetin dioxygenase-like cupin family protein